MLFTFSHRLFISLFFTLRICFLLDGDVALIIYTVKIKKQYGKKQAIQCVVQYFKIWFQSKYCGRTCRKSKVEMQGERTMAKTVSGIYVFRC